MGESEELEFENPLEEEVESVDVAPDKRKIYTELGDPEVGSKQVGSVTEKRQLVGRELRRLVVVPEISKQDSMSGL